MRGFLGLGTGVMTILAVTTTVTTAVAAVPQRDVTGEPAERAALVRFDAAVADYLRTHRLPDPVDLETLCLPEAATHASAARLDEPPPPREGDVFTAELVALVRVRIAALGLPTQRPPRRLPAVAVGDRLVAGRNARPPKAVVGILPPVSEELEYRLAGNDLVLLDLRTSVIVDALRDWRGR